MQQPLFYVRKFEEEYTAAYKDDRGFLAHFKDNSSWLTELTGDVLARSFLEHHFRFSSRMEEALRLLQNNASSTEAWKLIEQLHDDLLKYNEKTWVCC